MYFVVNFVARGYMNFFLDEFDQWRDKFIASEEVEGEFHAYFREPNPAIEDDLLQFDELIDYRWQDSI